MTQHSISSPYTVTKTGDEQQTLYGWMNVANLADGTDVIDSDGEHIPIEDLEAGAHEFLMSSAVSGVDHNGGATDGSMVTSIVFTDDVIDALTVDPQTGDVIEPLRKAMRDHLPRGWFGAFHIADEAAWAEAKASPRQAFSVEGTADYTEEIEV